MSLASNPDHRLISAPVRGSDSGHAAVGWWPRFVRAAGIVFGLLFLIWISQGGTMEGRVTHVVAFFISLTNPIWGIYALALTGPLYLTDQSNTHMLGVLETIAVGVIAGELRLHGRPVIDMTASGRAEPNNLRVHWGLWPFYLTGLLCILAAAALPGIIMLFFKERTAPYYDGPIRDFLNWTIFGPTTSAEWTVKCLWNWATSCALATIFARRANTLVVARWLKLGAVGLIVACVMGLLDWKGLLTLEHIRRVNPDPLQADRLQGPAGHPGWFGQWIVLMWPGILLWWSAGRTKRNVVIGAALGVVLITLVLTAARAAWLGCMVAAFCGAIHALSTYPRMKKKIALAFVVAGVLALVGVIVGGDVLMNRLVHLLRTDDRANYYVTGLLFLREKPFGIGLGMHYHLYEWLITPFYRWSQMDHVDSHSLWLQTLIECGPFMPLVLLAGVVGVALEFVKSRMLFDPPSRTILVAVGISFVGLLTISIAQYLPYIRVVELCTWLCAGAIVGLCRKARCRVDGEVESWSGRRILLASGACAIFVATTHHADVDPGNMPRIKITAPDGKLQLWTGREWRTPVNSDIDEVTFALYRKGTASAVEIVWPDGKREELTLAPEERRVFTHRMAPTTDHWTRKQDFLIIRSSTLWTPHNDDEKSEDRRHLGVYISEFEMKSALREKLDLPIRNY
ncbi:O-antigen ligase family protein [Candidatus Sumerlaeota bacterium]|nr:O-antigen ligase family protein [Candidatus Sumerlaeota bacterium]